MSLSLKKTKNIIKPKQQYIFNEKTYVELSNKIINETLGSFIQQFDIAKELANIVINMLNNEIYNYSYNTHINNIGVIKLILNVNGIFPNVNARFEGC